ncbi:hypothetical protein [Xylophilus ampelinus]|uniref:Uncharacterized protein n=1 Tax=Xylophilus ampelinus TaxID=54067 RepID=A0A318SGL1_9BURK|nr:hypothetical protein [Xylophilus ampelinus]MCS4510466.1 hypothetical protein [Xylophilus ampelinus]PYE77922.1 hypothetical protein DFQ15_11166 [Xylophilus ampelinus]
MNHSVPSLGANRPVRGAGDSRFGGRLPQQQQQQVSPARRRQQQQGSTDFQPVSWDDDGQPAHRPAPAQKTDKPATSKDGGHGGTPVGRLKNRTDTPGETKSYIDEASMNVDA